MLAPTRIEYLLDMELIALDERLCRVLDRTTSLFEQAKQFDEKAEAERIQKVNLVLAYTKRALDGLS
jgi:hypothetical protein